MADESTEYVAIHVPRDVREELREEKRDGESWGACLRRLAQHNYADKDWVVIDELHSLREGIREEFSHIPERTADEVEERLR